MSSLRAETTLSMLYLLYLFLSRYSLGTESVLVKKGPYMDLPERMGSGMTYGEIWNLYIFLYQLNITSGFTFRELSPCFYFCRLEC